MYPSIFRTLTYFESVVYSEHCQTFSMKHFIQNPICQHVLLKKFTIFLKFKFLKKYVIGNRHDVIFFLSQPEQKC